MWVRAYIAQLSAARAKPHRNRVCGPGHYGNSRAPGKRQVLSTLGKVAVTRGRGALQKAPEVPTRCGTVSLCGQPHAAAGLPLVTSIQGFNLLCQGSINPTSRLQPGFINETLTAFYCLVWHHSKEHNLSSSLRADRRWFHTLVELTCWTKQCGPDVAVRHDDLFSRSLKAEAADSQQQVQVH